MFRDFAFLDAIAGPPAPVAPRTNTAPAATHPTFGEVVLGFAAHVAGLLALAVVGNLIAVASAAS